MPKYSWENSKKLLSALYLRYIDDIFIISTGTKQQFIDFIGRVSVDFLDTTVYIDENSKLQTKLYRKLTDRRNYLDRKSEHPTNPKINIPYSQSLRIKRICLTIEEFNESCDALEEKFIQRGYSELKVV